MKPEDQVKVGQLLTASGQEIQKLAAENAKLKQENHEYRCKEAAHQLVEAMEQGGLLADLSPEAKLAEEQQLTKLAMTSPADFRIRQDAVKLASAGRGWSLGPSPDNTPGSTTPGKTSFDAWVGGGST